MSDKRRTQPTERSVEAVALRFLLVQKVLPLKRQRQNAQNYILLFLNATALRN